MHVGRGWTYSLCAYNYFAECTYVEHDDSTRDFAIPQI